MKRRELIKMLGMGLSVAPVSLNAPFAFGDDKQASSSRKVVWVMLRGGMDSLQTVVPAFDKDLMKHRRALAEPVIDDLNSLGQGFGLHPALNHLYDWYQNKEMAPVVAVASPYRSRSHFEGQDFLESGLTTINHDSGWLGRALKATSKQGLAVAHSLPVSMRGQANASTWFPSRFRVAEDDLYSQLFKLYQSDDLLRERLEQGLQTRAMAEGAVSGNKKAHFEALAKAAGLLLKDDNSPNALMLEMGGWDTHDNEVFRLNRQLQQLDEGMGSLKKELGSVWKETLVIIATEFGRTVKVNGTMGTDHGTASALLLAGGAVKGGQVLGEWPGLKSSQLYEGRDLMPTSDIRHWIGTAMQQHWKMSDQHIANVFPDLPTGKTTLIV
ncbi:DUF1501 domain-containing protein [Endozoicomonas montiporae]|nr:DUF1501 domain-containing protein [Endozoicomonas montiporae]AMO54860.1 hypothetical protein EZMO1_0620 [Endozoicomonas montiporae CL-33]